MKNDLTASKSIIVNATPDKMWDVLTNPAYIRQYLYGTETSTTWEVGEKVVFSGNYNGCEYRDHGIVLENVRHRKLSYSYWSEFSGLDDKPENYSVVTYELKKAGNNQTEFTWTQKGFSTEDNYKHSLDGMEDFLKTIKEVAEQNL